MVASSHSEQIGQTPEGDPIVILRGRKFQAIPDLLTILEDLHAWLNSHEIIKDYDADLLFHASVLANARRVSALPAPTVSTEITLPSPPVVITCICAHPVSLGPAGMCMDCGTMAPGHQLYQEPDTQPEQKKQTRKEIYDEYINFSPVWKAKRNARLILDAHQCRKCKTSERLVVHHRIYPDNLGDETLDHLVTLCWDCHNALHEAHRKCAPRPALNKFTADFLDEKPVIPRKEAANNTPFKQASKLVGNYGFYLKKSTPRGEKPAKYRLAGRMKGGSTRFYSEPATLEEILQMTSFPEKAEVSGLNARPRQGIALR